MSSSLSVTGRSALRSLLRVINANVTRVSGNDQWRRAAVQQFRDVGGGDEATALNAIELAQDYTRLVRNIAHHRALLLEYNIGIDVEERSKKMVSATARRVGFSLPDKLPAYDGDLSSTGPGKGKDAAVTSQM